MCGSTSCCDSLNGTRVCRTCGTGRVFDSFFANSATRLAGDEKILQADKVTVERVAIAKRIHLRASNGRPSICYAETAEASQRSGKLPRDQNLFADPSRAIRTYSEDLFEELARLCIQ